MLQLDSTGTLASSITPLRGIPDRELQALRTPLRRYTEEFVRERTEGLHLWAEAPYDKRALTEVKRVASKARERKWQTILWVGIGGSGLGPKVIEDIFEKAHTPEFIILDTIDPAVLTETLPHIDWKHTLIVIASKSGETIEPMSLFALLFQELRKARGKEASEHVIAITDPEEGDLRTLCNEEGITALPLPTRIGGRYSIFTPIGLLPLALLGGNADTFLEGARELDTLCQKGSLDENPASLLAATQFLLETRLGYLIRVIMPYSQRLREIARWDQQLIAESLGKDELRNPIPLAAVGTQDQHSLFQQWMAGPRKQWHLFICEHTMLPSPSVPENVSPALRFAAGKSFAELLHSCYEGTARALTSAKRPHATITLPELNEYHLGQLFFLLMAEVVLLAKLYRIDPYGQPAVEVGKKITREILSGN